MPQISQNMNLSRSTATQLAKLWADFTGAGAAIPTVSAITQLGGRDNYASPREGNTTGVVRNGVGDYTITFPTAPPSAAKVMWLAAKVRGATSGMQATVQSWVVTAGRLVVNVKTWTPAGAAADLANGTDFLRMALEVDQSNA
jgi:hypothetical protein